MSTLLLAAREIREALRSRWFVLAAASFGVLSLALAMLGLAGAQRSGLAGYDRTTAALLNLALVFVPLVTLSLGGLSISGELEDGSLSILLAQPITRAQAFVGKFLGLLLSLAAAIAVGFGITGVIVGVSTGGDATAFLWLLALTLLLSAATLAIGLWLSVWLRSRARVVGAAFAAWLVLVYLSDLGTIGLAVARELSPRQVFALALINPVEQARVLGVLALTHRPEVLGPVGIFGVDTFGAGGLTALLVGALVGCTLAALAAGWSLFRKAVIA